MTSHLLPTTVVGSYVQPTWLVDRDNLKSRLPPRVRAREMWKLAEPDLEEAQDAATLAAIRDMERAGIDIVSDGEIRRESYSNRFATALEGIDVDHPGTALDRTGHPNPVPRITGRIRRVRPVELRDAEFLVKNTHQRTKITLPGPFTMLQQAQNDHYPRPRPRRWTTPTPSTRRSARSSRPGWTWSSSMSRTSRPGPRRRRSTPSGPSIARSRA
jgi:5-methyltetrahydropteroyltriglutamate--homocysteine methyltransferase